MVDSEQARLGGDGVYETQHIERAFTVEPDQSSADIAEAFGIEAGYEKTVVDVELPAELPAVTYITGESGCGKTTLLRELGWSPDAAPAIPETPLYEWADSKQTALKLLSQVGLGDAQLFVSRYDELSDSQQYRARLYLKLLEDESPLFFDEFLSTLDRKTARPVAYVFQKVVRRLDKRVVVATAHSDLHEYLQPDLLVSGRAFPSRWDSDYTPTEPTNPFMGGVELHEKDSDWYREDCPLGELHYKGKYTGGVKDIYSATYDGRTVGVLVATYRMHDGGRRISRVVTHPSYRSVGIGQFLVEEYLDREPAADVVAAMAKYNPVFEKAGMTRVEDSEQSPPSGLITDLREVGFDTDQWYRKGYCTEFAGDEAAREVLAGYASDLSFLVSPGGEYLDDDEVADELSAKPQLAGRVLWNVRPKSMAKYVGPGHPDADD